MATYLLDGELTKRLRFRLLRPGDERKWLPFFQDPDVPRYWWMGATDPEMACQEFFQRMFKRYRKNLGGMNAIELISSNTLVGIAGILVQDINTDRELEVAYSLLPQYRGKGYATEAAAHCVQVAFERGWADGLVSIIHQENTDSKAVALRNGFQPMETDVHKDQPVIIFRKSREDGT